MKLLQTLGLNLLEAEVYMLLLTQDEPITAYRIGKAINKPTANVYKAIDSLMWKGAVMVDDGEPRLCRPVPLEEFLGHLEKTYVQTARQAAETLAHLSKPTQDERIYQIHSMPLIFERCRALLGRAETIAVIDIFPKAMEELLPAIEETAARGVETYVQVYEPTTIKQVHLVQAFESQEILAHWKCQQLNCVSDGKEVLLALMGNNLSKVFQAIWTQSPFLACVLHAGFLREHLFHSIAALKDQENFPSAIQKLLIEHPSFHSTHIPGQKLLFSRLGVEEI